MLGEGSFKPYAINTFSHTGKQFTTIQPVHFVTAHSVSSYRRKDGTLVSGYWRDGDGNSNISRAGGYFTGGLNPVSKAIRKG